MLRLLCRPERMYDLKEAVCKLAIHSEIFENETIEKDGNFYVPMEALVDLYESGVPLEYFDNFYDN